MTDVPRTVLEMNHITKRFPGIVANDDVSFDLREGEVHALLGENGAGKSTLMNILYGLYHPDEGEIRIADKPVQLGSPSAAIDAGVGMVHQHFMLIPVMTVAENIVLAAEPTHAGALPRHRRGQRSRARDLRSLRSRRRSEGRIEDITVGQQQRVEILKALYRNADILVLDEPTAVLTPQEAGELFEIIARPHRAGQIDHLHQPQAERGHRGRRPDHRPATGEDDRDVAGGGATEAEPRAADGRP